MQRALLILLALLLTATVAHAQPAVSDWLQRSQRAERAGQHARALRLLRRGLTQTPTDAALALALSAMLLPRDAAAAAESDAYTLDARVAEARAALANVAAVDGGEPEGETTRMALRRALWLEGAWQAALAGDLDGAREAIAARAPRVDRQAAHRAREVAALAIRRGDLSVAGSALALARAADATLEGLALEQAAVLAAQGRLSESAALLRRRVGAHPDDSAARVALARVLLADGEVDEALRLYRARSRSCRPHDSCTEEWARAALQARHFDLARRLAVELTESPDRASTGFTLLGLAEVGLGHRRAAADAFRGALARDPHDVQARASLGALENGTVPEQEPAPSQSAPGHSPAMLHP